MDHSPGPGDQTHDAGVSRGGVEPSVFATGPWDVRVRDHCASTNSEARLLVADGVPSGTVVVTLNQTAGRGRLTRSWVTPAGAALSISVVLVPQEGISPIRWPWLSLVTGLAVHDAVATLGVRTGLKWPNDVLAGDRKLAGILVERVEGSTGRPAAVVGVGLNVAATEAQVPATGTSLHLLGATTDATEVLSSFLAALRSRYDAWCAVGGDPSSGDGSLLADYRTACVTIGSDVRVHLPREATLEGRAVDVDADGHLVVEAAGRHHLLGVGDVVHVRAGGAAGSRPAG